MKNSNRSNLVTLLILSLSLVLFTSCSITTHPEQNEGNRIINEYENMETGIIDDTVKENTENEASVQYFESKSDFGSVKVMSDETYTEVMKLSNCINYMGGFEVESSTKDFFYRQKYFEMLTGEVPYTNELYDQSLIDLVSFSPENSGNYKYYYFDINGKGIPELIVFGDMKYFNLFTYNDDSNEVELRFIGRMGSECLLGDNKIGSWHGGTGLTYSFFKLNELWCEEAIVFFHSEAYYNEMTQEEEEIYLVGFDEKSLDISNLNKTIEKMCEDIYLENAIPYLRLSKEQYDDISRKYFDSREAANINIEQVTFTFGELFEDINMQTE